VIEQVIEKEDGMRRWGDGYMVAVQQNNIEELVRMRGQHSDVFRQSSTLTRFREGPTDHGLTSFQYEEYQFTSPQKVFPRIESTLG